MGFKWLYTVISPTATLNVKQKNKNKTNNNFDNEAKRF